MGEARRTLRLLTEDLNRDWQAYYAAKREETKNASTERPARTFRSPTMQSTRIFPVNKRLAFTRFYWTKRVGSLPLTSLRQNDLAESDAAAISCDLPRSGRAGRHGTFPLGQRRRTSGSFSSGLSQLQSRVD